MSEFLLIAAILVELKSQRLLPGADEVDDDEELVGWEERDLLLARLLECRAYAAAADTFVSLAEQAARSVPRQAGLDDGFVVHAPDLLAGVTTRAARPGLPAGDRRAAGAAGRPLPRDGRHGDRLGDCGATWRPSFPGSGATTFPELTGRCRTRIEVIVQFLALLELCKLGKVELGQGHTFGELRVQLDSRGPRARRGRFRTPRGRRVRGMTAWCS